MVIICVLQLLLVIGSSNPLETNLLISLTAKEVVDTVWAKAHDSVCKIAEDLINKALAGN